MEAGTDYGAFSFQNKPNRQVYLKQQIVGPEVN
jgi:hypothetical protein